MNRNLTIKLGAIALMILLLMIPLLMINGVIRTVSNCATVCSKTSPAVPATASS